MTDVIATPKLTGTVGPEEEDSPAPRHAYHRWSGWPGAWCFDCGQEDQNEICIAEHGVCITCIYGHVMCEDHHPMQQCTEHVNGPCPSPGAMHADPYAMRQARRDLVAVLGERARSETMRIAMEKAEAYLRDRLTDQVPFVERITEGPDGSVVVERLQVEAINITWGKR